MKTMTLMTALALLAATHAIGTRTASARENAGTTAIRTHDLPTVRVYATPEADAAPVANAAPRVHDLPTLRVYAAPEAAERAMDRAVASRASARRESLGIPRGGARRGAAPEGAPIAMVERLDRWVALGCVIRQRIVRVWPMQPCGGAASAGAMRGGGAMSMSLVERRR